MSYRYEKGRCCLRGRFPNRPYNGLILHAFPFPLPHTTSAGCLLVHSDQHPRGWGKGVCHTPLSLSTPYTEVVSSVFFCLFACALSTILSFHPSSMQGHVCVGAVREPPVYRDIEQRTHMGGRQKKERSFSTLRCFRLNKARMGRCPTPRKGARLP